MIIHPYNMGSRSARRIKRHLNEKHGRRVVSVLTRKPRGSKCLVVNWGGQEITYPKGQHYVVNPPSDVQDMSDKVRFFQRVGHDKNFLEWTEDRSQASEWGVKSKIFVRHLTRGSGGRGIDVWTAASGTVIPYAPLYTKHQAKTHEYRVHMARSLTGSEFEAILIQRKVWMGGPNVQPKTWDVRSHDNGFTFQSYPEGKIPEIPQSVLGVAKVALSNYWSSLHFAALDILYHKPTDTAIVCEGNTAPGVENRTVEVYGDYLLGLEEEFKYGHVVYPWR